MAFRNRRVRRPLLWITLLGLAAIWWNQYTAKSTPASAPTTAAPATDGGAAVPQPTQADCAAVDMERFERVDPSTGATSLECQRRRTPHGQLVSRTQMPETWPLTVDRGYLRCEQPGRAVVFTTERGRQYGVNGVAQGRYPSIEPIWAPDPDPTMAEAGARKGIGSLISLGLAMCGE